MVVTADFFTPIVDDPYWFGAIAAANSLSDVYAMGGRPLAALNIAMFPDQPELYDVLKEIMRGGIDKMTEASVPIIGGHTIRDKEPKYGFAVLGMIHPDKILDNTKAKPGDALILTKKIGTGIIATGIKGEKCGKEVIEEVTQSMAALNKRASEIMLEVGVSTATDITGFGLLGHLFEVLKASGCFAHVHSESVPLFAEAVSLAGQSIIPGGTTANSKSFDPYIQWSHTVQDVIRILLHDAQTSGGLLMFVPADKKDRLIAELQKERIPAVHIGDVYEHTDKDEKQIFVD